MHAGRTLCALYRVAQVPISFAKTIAELRPSNIKRDPPVLSGEIRLNPTHALLLAKLVLGGGKMLYVAFALTLDYKKTLPIKIHPSCCQVHRHELGMEAAQRAARVLGRCFPLCGCLSALCMSRLKLSWVICVIAILLQ